MTTLDDQFRAVGVQVEHHFAPHLYNKRTFIPPGVVLTQHVHSFDHASHLVAGTVVVVALVDGRERAEEYTAPKTLLIPAGVQHRVENRGREVAEWYCAHITDEIDPERVDDAILS